MCKNIEHTFGVLQRIFQILCPPFKKWDETHINQTVMACIMLHNMMVQEQVDRNSYLLETFCGMYDPHNDNSEHDNQHHSGSSSNNEAVTG